jgi:hypothetical protein
MFGTFVFLYKQYMNANRFWYVKTLSLTLKFEKQVLSDWIITILHGVFQETIANLYCALVPSQYISSSTTKFIWNFFVVEWKEYT